ncbi:MAG: hypothetical protein R6U32_02005 [Candidatus Woesearchaeota archaeon]
MAFVLLFFSATAVQGAEPDDFNLNIYEEYCDCDDDCGGFSSCLTSGTDEFIRGLEAETDDKIGEAEKEGYEGVCASVAYRGEVMVYEMTPNCTGTGDEGDGDTDESGDADDATAEDATGDSEEDIGTGDGTEDAGTGDEEGTAEDATSHVVTVDFTGGNEGDDKNGSSAAAGAGESEQEDTKNGKKPTGGFRMDLITAGLVSGTIVLVGFFALMGWIAYLLQKKTNEGKEKK